MLVNNTYLFRIAVPQFFHFLQVSPDSDSIPRPTGSQRKFLIGFYTTLLKNISWIGVSINAGDKTDGIRGYIKQDKADLFCYDLAFTGNANRNDHVVYTEHASGAQGTQIIAFIPKNVFRDKVDIIYTMNTLSREIYMSVFIVLLSICLSFVLLRNFNDKKESNFNILYKILVNTIAYIHIRPYGFKEKFLWIIYVFTLICLLKIFLCSIKTSMVIIDSEKFVDNIEQLQRKKELVTYVHPAATLYLEMSERKDYYPDLFERIQRKNLVITFNTVNKLLNDADEEYIHNIVILQGEIYPVARWTLVLICHATQRQIWLSKEIVSTRNSHMIYNDRLEKYHKDRIEYIAITRIEYGFWLKFRDIRKSVDCPCIVESKDELIDKMILSISYKMLKILIILYSTGLFIDFIVFLYEVSGFQWKNKI